MNARAKVAKDGTITLPKSVRDAHGWREGVELEFVEGRNGVVIQSAQERDPRFPPITTEELLARRIKIDYPFPPDAEIEEALLAEAARRFNATRR